MHESGSGRLRQTSTGSVLKKSIELPQKAMTEYHAFKREKVLELDNNESLLAANAGVLCGQLLQMTSGEIYKRDQLGNKLEEVATIHAAKLEALDDLIESANQNPVMVFYYFKHELKRIKEHLKKQKLEVRSLENEDDVRDWNDGKIDVLLLHPASSGHGLNLQRGGHIAIWYTLPNWNLELYQQANARIYRQGQQQNVTIYQIIARGTVDEDMLDALEHKNITQKALIEALRR